MNTTPSPFDLALLQDASTHQLTTFNLENNSKTIKVEPGQTVTIGEVDGQGFIAQLWLTFPGWFWQHWNQEAAIDPSILKLLFLKITFDDAKVPAVYCPAGDFFGVGLCETANFASAYFGQSSGGFFCRFPMPFSRCFKVEIENRHPEMGTEIFLNTMYQIIPQLPENAGYFHCQFRTGRDLQQEFTIADTTGSGHFAGCTLSMQGKKLSDLSFLEAPETIYVDDHSDTPRIHGTGLEDYFLGGWYFREGEFTGSLHGVPVKDAMRSSVVMYRTHTRDAIHFKKNFRFRFFHPWKKETINPFFFSSASYFYLSSPEGIPAAKYTREELLGMYRIRDREHQSIP